jgi:hypothetical protein
MSVERYLEIAVTSAAVAVLLIAAPLPAAAGDVAKELATTEQHAGFAVGGADLKAVQTHLQHVVNCMVGPKGRGFDATQANPCKDQGDGLMADVKSDKTKRASLQKALDAARGGLKAADLAAAKQRASDADAILKKAM